ncbi:MAG TPA: hypothetical protein VIM89_11150 [Mucilaginibacter sp.]
MKRFAGTLLVLAAISFIISCKKEKSQPAAASSKTIKFVLYTNEDFSTDEDTIRFALTIRNNAGTIKSRSIFDTTLMLMKIKDIPGPSNKLVFSKTVPDDGTLLEAGFIYYTRFGVGSKFDTVSTNEKLKVFEYPFQ